MKKENTNSDFALSKPPLVCVVAKVIFAPIAKIKGYVDDLQDTLRQQGFLHFETRQSNTIQINHKAEAGANVKVGTVEQWIIADKTRNISLRVDQTSISILFGDYTSFSDANPLYLELLQAIETNIKGIQYNELQLRYINHIPQEKGQGADFWVKPFVLGMPNLVGLQRSASVSETSYSTKLQGRLILRCSALPAGLTLPPNLLPLEVGTRVSDSSQTPFILLENLLTVPFVNEKFEAEALLGSIRETRKDIHQAFRDTVTKRALELWK